MRILFGLFGPRKMKRLLRILRKHLPDLMTRGGNSGICACITDLHYGNIITYEEAAQLRNYIKLHRPANSGFLFWWPANEIPPRITFLTQLIKEL